MKRTWYTFLLGECNRLNAKTSERDLVCDSLESPSPRCILGCWQLHNSLILLAASRVMICMACHVMKCLNHQACVTKKMSAKQAE